MDRQKLSGTKAQGLAVTSSRCVSVTAERVWVRTRVSMDSSDATLEGQREGDLCAQGSQERLLRTSDSNGTAT